MFSPIFENNDCGCFMNEEPFLLFSYENDANDFINNREVDDRRYFQDNYIFEEKTKETNIKLSQNYPQKDLPKKEIIPSFCSLNTANELIGNNDHNYRCNETLNQIVFDKTVLEEEEYLNSTQKKTIDDFMFPNDIIVKQGNSNNLEYEIKDNKYLKTKRGRKGERADGEEHDRYYADNIIKKIKAKIFDYLLKFINKFIYTNNENGIQLLKTDYKYIDQLNRKKNLDLFEMSLMDLLSLDVSGRHKSKSKDYNKKMIKEIQQRLDLEDYDTILFLFNISLNDYIDLFTYKKDIFELANQYNALNVNFTKIKDNFVGANDLLSEIAKNNDAKYYTLFVLYTFNFQRWFFIKKGRNRKSKKFN